MPANFCAVLHKAKLTCDAIHGRKLAGTCTFFVLALVVVFMQRDIPNSFAVEDSLLTAILDGEVLPPREEGGYLNSGRCVLMPVALVSIAR